MAQYIDKSALVAEIKRILSAFENSDAPVDRLRASILISLLSFINTLEVRDVVISIPNIDDTLKEEGLDPDSKEAKVFKESYYMALEKLKAQKGEKV